jgi:hypothetical protein
MLAKQSTALTVVVGPILDSTGAEYASAVIGDLSISKNGGTLTAMASAATLTYIANGMYTLVTTTANMDTLGAVQVTCNKATYQMPKMERNVVPASVYDAIITNATNATGGLPTATAAITGLAGVISTYAGGAVASVTNPVTVGTNNDKTGYTATVSDKTGFKLASDGLALVTAWTVGITGNLTGNVTGSVGSISGVSFPANFSSMVINGGNGHVAVVVHAFQNAVLTAAAIAAGALNGKGDWLTTLGASAPANWINAAAIADGAIDAGSIAADALNGKGNWLTSLGANAPAGWINAASITTDAITGDKIDASAVTKITVNLFKYGDIQLWTSPANQIQVSITKV